MSETLVRIGWTLLVILLETAVVAVPIAIWRLIRPRSSARLQYIVFITAFVAMVLMAAATPRAIRFLPSITPAPGVELMLTLGPWTWGIGRTGSTAMAASDRAVWVRSPAGPSVDAVLAIVAVAWIVGLVFLACRLAGGLILARSILRRSAPVNDEAILSTADRLRQALGLKQSIALRQSADVEAPVVVGWGRAAVILPTGAASVLDPNGLEPLLTHELAHVRRADYPVNLLQSIAEIPLFFSPAALWMSRRIREAREYCCDDAAMVSCGDPQSYIKALMTLASLSTINAAKPVLGASGPRLIVRARRLLQAEATPRMALVRAAALALILAGLVPAAWRVALAASQTFPADVDAPATVASGQADVPYGYGAREDSGVELSKLKHSVEQPLQSIVVRNVTIEPMTGIRLAAVVERVPFGQTVEIFSSELVPLRIAPDASVQLANVRLPGLQQAKMRGRTQVIIGVQEVRFANGSVWQMRPNPAARDHREALGYLPAELTRAFLNEQTALPAGAGLCRDQDGRSYSLGAVVAVRNEPGRFARCVAGRWERWER